jgi:hypothetical protein
LQPVKEKQILASVEAKDGESIRPSVEPGNHRRPWQGEGQPSEVTHQQGINAARIEASFGAADVKYLVARRRRPAPNTTDRREYVPPGRQADVRDQDILVRVAFDLKTARFKGYCSDCDPVVTLWSSEDNGKDPITVRSPRSNGVRP